MKKFNALLGILLMSTLSFAQTDLSKMSSENTWLKLGINAAVPIGDFSNTQGVGLGLDVGLQFLETKASGIGVKAGYINYFGKDNNDDVVVIPLALMFRYYPESVGIFAGLEVGYAFVSGLPGTSGGGYTRPQLGLHYYDWNFFGYYEHVETEAKVANVQAIGLGITYNLRFK